MVLVYAIRKIGPFIPGPYGGQYPYLVMQAPFGGPLKTPTTNLSQSINGYPIQ